MAIGSGKSTEYFDNSSEFQAEKTDLAMPCHQGGNAATDDVSTSNHCQMLCAAIGHVVVSTAEADQIMLTMLGCLMKRLNSLKRQMKL